MSARTPVAGVVRTVLGDVPAERLGRVDYHEHLFMRSPLLRGDELDDLDRSARATIGYDGMARAKYWPDSVPLDCLEATVERAREPYVVLGGDVARRSSFVAYGGQPGMTYLPERFVPRVRRRLGDEFVEQVLVTNPARLFAADPVRSGPS